MSLATVKEFQERLTEGVAFEQIVVSWLAEHRWVLRSVRSAKDQYRFGDTMEHIEIKLDSNFRRTKNLYIETEERRDISGFSKWRASGIYDASDPWILAQGDSRTLWLLPVTTLRYWHQKGTFKFHAGDTQKGFLLPVYFADLKAIRKLER